MQDEFFRQSDDCGILNRQHEHLAAYTSTMGPLYKLDTTVKMMHRYADEAQTDVFVPIYSQSLGLNRTRTLVSQVTKTDVPLI